jgi:pimeloyl-ACP methyl ester carboxylesterase
MSDASEEEYRTPLSELGLLAVQEVEIAPGLLHVEMYTRSGLLTLLWHGERDAERVLLTGGGAMGSLLGPADGLFHDLGVALAAQGIGTVRVGYRTPNNLPRCIHDMAVASQLAAGKGAEKFVAMGHSFGGAVAIGVGASLPSLVLGVVTLSTQSAGCEPAASLAGRRLLLLHGDKDEILPPVCSQMVRQIAGAGEVRILEGAGHLLSECPDELRQILLDWIPATLALPNP